jgi:HAD superfamily hydrolase (TIGR01509 family)
MQQRIQLVIFDCDGVLVDSEPIAETVLGAVLSDLGVDLPQAEVRRIFFGKTVAQCIGLIESMTGRVLTTAEIAAWRERLYREFREAPVEPVDGVREVLDTLRGELGLPLCVVSNGPIEKMETTLGVTGLRSFFADKLFSPDLGMPGKPAPDLFLAAAGAFGVAPLACVVVEDSAGGVAGARAAGMHALGFAGSPQTDAGALAAAGAELFTNMRLLPGLLAGR